MRVSANHRVERWVKGRVQEVGTGQVRAPRLNVARTIHPVWRCEAYDRLVEDGGSLRYVKLTSLAAKEVFFEQPKAAQITARQSKSNLQ